MVPTEQNSLPSILDSDTNFDEKNYTFSSNMAKVDVSPTESESSSQFGSSQMQNDVLPSSPNNLKENSNVASDSKLPFDIPNEELDVMSSDIELNIDTGGENDSDEKSKSNVFFTKNTTKNIITDKLTVTKDTESIESLDNDLSNTAHLVGKSFLQDGFDSVDYLDDDGSPLDKISAEKLPPKSRADGSEHEQSTPDKSCEKPPANDSKISDATQATLVNDQNTSEKSPNEGDEDPSKGHQNEEVKLTNTESESPVPECADDVTDVTISNVERKNVTTDSAVEFTETVVQSIENENQVPSPTTKTDEFELNDESQVHTNPPRPSHEVESSTEKNDGNYLENMESRTEPPVKSGEECEVEKSQDVGIENATRVISENKNELEDIHDSKLANSTILEAPSLESKNSNLSENKSHLLADSIEDGSKNAELSAKDFLCKDIPPVGEITVNSESRYDSSLDNNTKVGVDQDCSDSSGTNLSSSKTVDLSKNDIAAPKITITSENNVPPVIDIAEKDATDSLRTTSSPPIIDVEASTARIDSPSSCHDNNDLNTEPKSVESTEFQIIDLVEPEVVDLEDVDESMEVSENMRQSVNQLFENTAKEISSCDMITEDISSDNRRSISANFTCTGDRIVTESIHPEIVLNRHNISNSENRKRKLNQSEDLSVLEKRSKSDTEYENCDIIGKENLSICSNGDVRKKNLGNTARKHTSSTNTSKIVKEIENKLRADAIECSKASNSMNGVEEAIPAPQTVNEYDYVVNESVVGSASLDRGDVIVPPVDDRPKIALQLEHISKDSLQHIFSMMKTKLTRRQLEEIVLQKCCEVMADSSEISELRRKVNEMQQAEFYRKQKILNLEKQIHQLKAVCQKYLEQTRENKGDRSIMPIRITRSVGLQVAIESNPHVTSAPQVVNNKSEDRLKKLLLSSSTGKRNHSENRRSSPAPRSHSNSGAPVNSNNKNRDLKLPNNNYNNVNGRASSSSPAPCTSPLSSNTKNNSVLIKKIAKPVESSSTVIDLTDKDDKNDNEANEAASNLLASVNGTVLAYLPVTVNHDSNGPVWKPGTPVLVNGQLMTVRSKSYTGKHEHPAPVPATPPAINRPGMKSIPPRPLLKISKNSTGIMLSWTMPLKTPFSTVSKYQLFVYQEIDIPPSTDLWKEVGEVDALPLPMACTLTQFQEGHRYHFIVRAVDIHGRMGPFSSIESILL